MTSNLTVITGFANVNYWIGTSDAVEHLPQTCMFGVPGAETSGVTNIVFLTPKVFVPNV